MMEIAVAVGLLVPRLRNAAVVGAIATHLVVLGLLGPLAHGTNAVIWPWNGRWPCWRRCSSGTLGDASALDTLVPRRVGAHAAALLLFGIMPVLSFAGRWDAYLSGELYSGNLRVGALSITDTAAARLPDAARRHVVSNGTGANALDLWEWSMGELSVPSYPEDRVFRAVARDVCRLAGNPGDVVLVVFGRPGLRQRPARDHPERLCRLEVSCAAGGSHADRRFPDPPLAERQDERAPSPDPDLLGRRRAGRDGLGRGRLRGDPSAQLARRGGQRARRRGGAPRIPTSSASSGTSISRARIASSIVARWRERPGMLGFRFTFNQPQQKAWWTDGSLDWFWAACERARPARRAPGRRATWRRWRRSPSGIRA